MLRWGRPPAAAARRRGRAGAGDDARAAHLPWEEADDEHWQVTLRCPSCEWSGRGRFPSEVVDRLDEELERRAEALAHDLKRLTRANMGAELDRFVAALAADAIQPMDF